MIFLIQRVLCEFRASSPPALPAPRGSRLNRTIPLRLDFECFPSVVRYPLMIEKCPKLRVTKTILLLKIKHDGAVMARRLRPPTPAVISEYARCMICGRAVVCDSFYRNTTTACTTIHRR